MEIFILPTLFRSAPILVMSREKMCGVDPITAKATAVPYTIYERYIKMTIYGVLRFLPQLQHLRVARTDLVLSDTSLLDYIRIDAEILQIQWRFLFCRHSSGLLPFW